MTFYYFTSCQKLVTRHLLRNLGAFQTIAPWKRIFQEILEEYRTASGVEMHHRPRNDWTLSLNPHPVRVCVTPARQRLSGKVSDVQEKCHKNTEGSTQIERTASPWVLLLCKESQ
jgi:hypothetical protein